MPVEKRPVNPVHKGYIPPNFKAYKVKKGESLETIARANNMELWELIYDNFKTKNPAEANWYLKNHVGCSEKTKNGADYIFSSNDSPGVIYIPDKTKAIPNVPKKVEPAQSILRNVWAGVGKSHSGDLFVIGAHDLTGMVYNLGDEVPDIRNALVNINGFKFGPGLGASVGAVFVIAYGYPQAHSISGVTGGKDFDLAIGAKLGDLLKGLSYLGKAVDTLDKYKKMRYLTENIVKNMVLNGSPGSSGIITLPIPLAGAGIHLWGGFKFGTVSVMSTGKGIY